MRRTLWLAVLCLALVGSSAQAQELCSSLRGATVVADDGTYLGTIDAATVSESILNEYGTYGSKYSAKSIWNEFGTYGSEFSTQSPFNRYSSTPPAVVRRGDIIGYLVSIEMCAAR